MKKFILKKLTITNFKGIRRFTANFGPHTTNIRGTNGTGKTTVLDAFRWLLFGKDSTDRTKFEIKTLDLSNQPFHHLDHEVEANIEWQGVDLTLRRVFKEKWTQKKGSRERELIGHVQEFFWNDAPLKEGEYQAKISSIMDEGLFKLLTMPTYFNNNMDWQARRRGLMMIAGEITNEDILHTLSATPEKYEPILSAIARGDSLLDMSKAIAIRKKKIQDELNTIPTRIDEATRALNGIPEYDYPAIAALRKKAEQDAVDIERQLMQTSDAEKSRQQALSEKIKEVYQHRERIQKIEFSIKAKMNHSASMRKATLQQLKNEHRIKTDEKSNAQVELSTEEKRVETWKQEQQTLRTRWEDINKEELIFKPGELECPSCHRPLDEEEMESKKLELTANFKTDKSRRLQEVNKAGTDIGNRILASQAKIEKSKAAIKLLTGEIELLQESITIKESQHASEIQNEAANLEKTLNEDTEILAIKEMIKLREEEISTPPPPAGDEAEIALLMQKRTTLKAAINEYYQQETTEKTRKDIQTRIEELGTQEQSLAQQLADQENLEYLIQTFERGKMDTLELRVNTKFKLVQFKMFTEQVNGGKADNCVTLIGGVPWMDANTASKIHAGIDIINTFSEYYNIAAPIWIDNRESVITIPETQSQLVNLFASEQHTKLTVDKQIAEASMA